MPAARCHPPRPHGAVRTFRTSPRSSTPGAEPCSWDLSTRKRSLAGTGCIVGDRGVAVGGSVSGSTIVTGDGNRVELASNVTLQEFLALLAELRALIPQAGLEERRVSTLVQDLRLVQEEAGAARPDRPLIVTRLKGVTGGPEGAGAAQEADKMLLPMAEKALAAARNLFP